eukprot:1158748-Pelagomonas_calceolata.AAC.15
MTLQTPTQSHNLMLQFQSGSTPEPDAQEMLTNMEIIQAVSTGPPALCCEMLCNAGDRYTQGCGVQGCSADACHQPAVITLL